MSYNSDLQSNNADLQAILDAVNELPEAGGGGADGFSPIATVTQTDDGAVIEITDKYGKTEATVLHGKDGKDGTDGKDGKDGSDASVTKANISTALGYTPADPGQYAVSVKALGAKGDGSTDDTAIIQSALATYRKVYVPGGTYKISGELVIRDNCQLELAQDTVLNFAQTSGNCITVNRSSWLKGNHATVFVPYAFTGHVVNVDTSVHTNTKDVPPFVHWDPQWKTARYLTDLNICKMDSYGLGRSTSGDSNGTAVYVTAVGGATSTFIWGLNFSGLRIAGAFEYGLRAVTTGSGYNHEMRVEAFMDAVKIGVSLEDCNNAYISATVQPRVAADGSVYAEHGIQLIRSKNTDLLGSRVWDWNAKTAKWDIYGQYQHIALYGDCKGTIMNDYNYHSLPSGAKDIRDIIYTDTASNFDSLIVIQEPLTKWFKSVDYLPYFNNGVDGNQRLALKSEQDALFQTSQIAQFTNQLPRATDKDGSVFFDIGYKIGRYWEIDGTLKTDSYNNYGCTGFIKVNGNSLIKVRGFKFTDEGYQRAIYFDSDKNKTFHANAVLMLDGTDDYFFTYTEVDDGFDFQIKASATAAYVVFNFKTSKFSPSTVITVDEEIVYKQAGFLADGIYVKGEYVEGMGDLYMRQNQKVLSISAASTDEQYPTAKAVYDLVQQAIAAAIGQ